MLTRIGTIISQYLLQPVCLPGDLQPLNRFCQLLKLSIIFLLLLIQRFNKLLLFLQDLRFRFAVPLSANNTLLT